MFSVPQIYRRDLARGIVANVMLSWFSSWIIPRAEARGIEIQKLFHGPVELAENFRRGRFKTCPYKGRSASFLRLGFNSKTDFPRVSAAKYRKSKRRSI
jgi:hypothetical protein